MWDLHGQENLNQRWSSTCYPHNFVLWNSPNPITGPKYQNPGKCTTKSLFRCPFLRLKRSIVAIFEAIPVPQTALKSRSRLVNFRGFPASLDGEVSYWCPSNPLIISTLQLSPKMCRSCHWSSSLTANAHRFWQILTRQAALDFQTPESAVCGKANAIVTIPCQPWLEVIDMQGGWFLAASLQY